jgi:maltose O-acetyltransferase
MIQSFLRAAVALVFERLPFFLLTRFADYVPVRQQRWLASFYPDARIRRLFFQKTSVVLGQDTYPNPGIIVLDRYNGSAETLVEIGDRVALSPGIIFIADSNPNASDLVDLPYVRERLIRAEKIVVEDDVWIGAGAIIFPGVRVGRRAIIGAGAVVRQDVAAGSIVAGVPARVIGSVIK